MGETDANTLIVGAVVVGLTALFGLAAIILNIVIAVKKLGRIEPDKEYVTRAELKETVDEIEKKIDNLKSDIRIEMGDISKKMDKASDYQHVIAHEQANHLHNMGLRVERLITVIDGPRSLPISSETK